MSISAKARRDAQVEAYRRHMEAQGVRTRAAENIEKHGIPVEEGTPTMAPPRPSNPAGSVTSPAEQRARRAEVSGQPAGERVRSDDVDTAQNAARMTDNVRIALHCLELHAEHRDGGLIDHELGPLGGFPDGNESYRRRGSELRALGLIDWLRGEDGKVLKRLTPMGAPARVCRITAAGVEAHRTGVLPKRAS